MVALSSKLALIDGGGVQAMALGFKGAVKEWEKKRVLSDESVQGNSAPISPGTQNAAEPKAAYASSPEEGSPEGGSQEGAPEVHFLQSLNLDNAPPKAPLDTPLDTPVLTAHHAPHHLQAPALDHQQPKSGRPGSFSNVSPPKFSQQSVADLVDLLASEVSPPLEGLAKLINRHRSLKNIFSHAEHRGSGRPSRLRGEPV